MSILMLLLTMIQFTFGGALYRANINEAPAIDACASGSCVEQLQR